MYTRELKTFKRLFHVQFVHLFININTFTLQKFISCTVFHGWS